MQKECISKSFKIWKTVIRNSIFDIQLHEVLAIKLSAGETESRQKEEVAPRGNRSPSKGGRDSRKHQISKQKGESQKVS